MYCFNFFRNQLWQHLISYNSFRNMNMCLLEVAMCEKCRSSHFQSEGVSKKFEYWGGWKILGLGGITFAGVSVPHYMPCYFHLPIDPFHCAKFKKILTLDTEFWRCAIFGPNMDHLPQTIFFLENYYHSHLPISFFHCAKSKKTSSSGFPVMRMCNFWT